MTTLLQHGAVETLIQNVIYALPTSRSLLFTNSTAATVQQSTDPAFAANVALAFTNGQMEVAGGYIRCTSGNIDIMLKKL